MVKIVAIKIIFLVFVNKNRKKCTKILNNKINIVGKRKMKNLWNFSENRNRLLLYVFFFNSIHVVRKKKKLIKYN